MQVVYKVVAWIVDKWTGAMKSAIIMYILVAGVMILCGVNPGSVMLPAINLTLPNL